MYKFPLFLFLISVMISLIHATTASDSYDAGGYPAGYLSDCPNKTIPITQRELQYLAFVVRGIKSNKRLSYNYFESHLIPKNKYMDWEKKTLIYVGGLGDYPGFPNDRILEKLYANKGYNVLLLDEGYFVINRHLPIVVALNRSVAKYVAEMLATIYNSGVLDPSKVEMVGLSMGAQTMSLITKEFYKLTGRKMSRLTGLDPSGPCFRNLGPDHRLYKTDGDFVEAIHTNIDFTGMAAPLGHVDYYVNGGEHQVSGWSGYNLCGALCSHMKALSLWVSVLSMPDAKFIAMKCESVQQARLKQCYDNKPKVTNTLGFNVDKSKQGIFYLATYNRFPYYMGKKGLNKGNEDYHFFMNAMFKDFEDQRRMSSNT